ncbi:MAG: hypothetical protein ABSD44_04995 [Terracidiphilus sp.]
MGLGLAVHHLGDILPDIERVILMRAGHVAADGPRDALFASHLSYSLVIKNRRTAALCALA